MTYKRVITPSAKRSLKKLPLSVRTLLIKVTNILATNPYAGSKLSAPLHFLYSLHFKANNVQYRTAYTVDKQNKLVIIHFAHTRENFYEKLHKLFR